jgi:enoyl-CoA hydratase/carnithine racemase
MVAVSRAAHRKQAMEMLLTGETIDASTAKDFGLVNRIVPKQYLTQVVNKYAAVIASKSPQALNIGKQAFYRQLEMSVEDAYDDAVKTMVANMMMTDAEEGIGAFLGKRLPEWNDE